MAKWKNKQWYHLSNGYRVGTCYKQIHDAFTYTFFMWPYIISIAFQQISQERNCLQ